MFKRGLKLISSVLVFALVCQIVPLGVFAEENAEQIETEEAILEMTEEVILEEISDKRTEYSKEFLTNKGNHMAVVYAEAVHYEENGKWKEIDNSLILQEDGTYSNAAGVWDVRLPQDMDEEKQISITKDGYTLSFGLAGELLKEDQPIIEIPIVKPNLEVNGSGGDLQETVETMESSGDPAEEIAETSEVVNEPNIEEVESSKLIPEESTEESNIPEESTVVENKSVIEGDGESTVIENSSLEESGNGESEEEEPATGNPSTEESTTALPEDSQIEKETEIADEIEETEAFELNQDGFQIKPMQLTTAEIQEIDVAEAKEAAEFEEFVNEKIMSQLLYQDVYENTNVQYDLQSNRVKESVIIDQYNERLQGYRYELSTGNMIPVLREDGRIDFYDENQRELIMMMEAPFLVDDNQEFSFDVEVSREGASGKYILEYVLPTDWLADTQRAWPVVLDPVISASADVKNIQDATVASKTVFEYTRPINEVGYYSVDGKERFYIMYESLPLLTSADVILGATIKMYKPNTSPASAVVQVHKVEATWDSQTITWSNKPAYTSKVQDFLHVQNAGYYTFDVTDIVRGWYEGENTGMLFKAESDVEGGGVDNYKEFYSSDYGSDLYMPQLVVTYRNNNGLESYWDYTASSAGRAGTGYINNFTGNMVWVREDIGFGGNRMPVTIQHVYN
ncbi:MAG: DNRLRE domain-containing protein, partial [Firmicutes bacterium]|nr:DNRLRE domain-containing protein [Bacillota bacterium]